MYCIAASGDKGFVKIFLLESCASKLERMRRRRRREVLRRADGGRSYLNEGDTGRGKGQDYRSLNNEVIKRWTMEQFLTSPFRSVEAPFRNGTEATQLIRLNREPTHKKTLLKPVLSSHSFRILVMPHCPNHPMIQPFS